MLFTEYFVFIPYLVATRQFSALNVFNDMSFHQNILEKTYEECYLELSTAKKSNGCIYRHPNMDLNGFNNDYLNPLLVKLSKEKESVPFG